MYLRQAANGADPFYATLARAVLGQDTTVPPTGSTRRLAALAMLQASAGGSRALALGQVGELDLAMSEVRHLAPQADARLGSALDWLAHELDSPDSDETELELRRGAQGVFYPLPRWKPRNGYKLDPALVYAVIHSESSFDPRARSRAGAVGLMQVLPETAALLAKVGKTRKPSVGELFEPETNLRYGQAYLAYLMAKPRFGDNLIYTIAAYNAGPVRVEAWIDAFGAKTDPLAFIETIPVAETRSYIKRVLTAYWIYEARLERSSPSLHALAENRWPRYPNAKAAGKPSKAKHVKADAGR
jgi:soluble lytic murein transglycosylase-like protein